MTDPLDVVVIGLLSSSLAGAVTLLCGWPWRAPRPGRTLAGCLLGLALGLYAGCWLMGCRPHWPPREDRDRLLLLLMPALLGVELLAAMVRRHALLEPLRLFLAVLAARILLHDSVYLADLSGPDTREWSLSRAVCILGGLSAALLGVWVLLTRLARRSGGRAVVLSVALTCAGATMAIMLSGYASILEFGAPLAASLAAIAVASLALSGDVDLCGVLGVAVVGLFALLVVGHFFGRLSTPHAVLLFFAPLLGWLPELSYVRRVAPRLSGCGRLLFPAVPVLLVLLLARQQFVRDAARIAPTSAGEPSVEDYMNFGK